MEIIYGKCGYQPRVSTPALALSDSKQNTFTTKILPMNRVKEG